MTIPTRPAPPPPGTQRLANRSNRASLHQSNVQLVTTVKAPPPRPPPPKVQEPPALNKKSSGGQLLSNIFGAKKANKKGYEKTLQMQQDVKVPPKIPAPPSSLHFHHQQQQQPRQMTDTQLISFDDDFFSSTSASPTLTQKSSSDCVSVDSFSSESYSPQNGGASGESGFEDDFSVSDFKVSSNQRNNNNNQINDPFDSLDHFAITQITTPHVPSNIRNVRVNAMQPQNAISIGSASFYASTSTINCGPAITKFDDSLCNGKSLIQPQAMLSMPTIIKPTITKGKVSPTYHQQQHQQVPLSTNQKSLQPLKVNHQLTRTVESFDEEEEDFSSLPSLPMPNCPPPPPPTINALLDDDEDLDQEKLSHGFTLYDYESDLTEDLNFKANEKIYLIKQMNDEWMLGRNKRGCEGIFPLSYIEIKVPLQNVNSTPKVTQHLIKALYDFNAETSDDLTIKENDVINVIYQINNEWLYGSNNGKCGQFPANYIEYIPECLPTMPSNK
ncbi:unnamed protein product [Diamesa tonsa]